MKILISVGAKLEFYGMGNGGYKLAQSLSQAGAEVVVICYGAERRELPFRVKTLAPTWWLQKFPYWTPLRFRPNITYSLQNSFFDWKTSNQLEPADLLYSYVDQALFSMRRQTKIAPHTVKIVHAANSHIDLMYHLLNEEYRQWGTAQTLISQLTVRKIKAEYQKADYIRTQSQWVYQTLVERGVPEEKLFWVPPAVDLERYRPASALPEQFRVCFVGSFDLRKGIQYLLPAWDSVYREWPGAKLIMHGGSGSRFINRYLAPYQRRPEIEWPGGGPADQTFRHASVCVVPSIEDGFCYVVLEAMASGLPVIVTEHVGAKDLIEEGVNGFVVPIRESKAIVERLQWFYRHPDRLREMSLAARRTAEKYSYTAEGSKLMARFIKVQMA